MKKILFFIFISCIISSCAVFDSPMRLAGFSTQKFDNEPKGRYEQTFDLQKKEAFDKTLSSIKRLRARVTSKSYKKGYIVAFDFTKSFDYCLDSTEAQFKIEETGAEQVKITVICNNSLLAKNLSDKIFTMIAENPVPENN